MIVRRLGVWSVAKMYGTIAAAMGLLLGLLVACASLLGAGLASQSTELPGGMAAAFGVGAVVILPLLYGVFGVIGGAIGAGLYNLFAGLVGGVELDIS
ncbi:MAG: hypothetical protein ABJC89_20270 [Acidobacteriota bacterium]